MDRLAEIESPEDLRRLGRDELAPLARELRDYLIEVGTEIGGHFAGSLGTVELTIALHYLLDTPRDRIVWDVGHQGYGHKVLTGRREALRQIKRPGGPSGFLRRSESEYDAFGAGHAGTSVSAGLGLVEASRRQGRGTRVVAILGDGAATAGMSFEGLNHTGEIQAPLHIVYNDNGMSIAPSVGGLARTGAARSYFEALRLRYLGPVDGHDLAALLPAVEELLATPGPTVLHVRTRKGRGYDPAEADPYRWHATTPFDRSSGVRTTSPAGPPSWTSVFSEALSRLADRDPRVVAITAAMPDGTGLDRFALRHPDRMYDVGIAEQHAVGFAAGLAAEGLRPVCAIYSTFLQRAYDQIIHDVALQRLPVVFALDRAGLVGADGPTHHGVFDLGYLRMIPNLVVAAPRNEPELQRLLGTAVDSGRPFALRFPRGPATGKALEERPEPLEIGSAQVLRAGSDVALVGLGKTLDTIERAAATLASEGISAQVIDARFVKPLDRETLGAAARHCGHVVTVEDHAALGGLGSAVLELLASEAPHAQVRIHGLPDHFVEHGQVDAQWRDAQIDAESVANATRLWLDGARDPRRRTLRAPRLQRGSTLGR
ncbi:MAG: 1-deoxy-D-xylulose-5-phosphate synthase [Myxococcota bacterium]